MTKLSKDQDIAKLSDLSKRVDYLLELRSSDSPEIDKWRRDVGKALSRIFGEDSEQLQEFKVIEFPKGLLPESLLVFIGNLRKAQFLLKSMAEEVQDSWVQEEKEAMIKTISDASEKKVFLVHGRNEAIKHKVARFLEKSGLQVTILDEQPSAGGAIIDRKLIEHSDVGFAVVLLTGDDQGGLKEESCESQRPRARQNVIFELGFFIGKIGRQKVCALYEEEVEIPSNNTGVVFVPIDVGEAWKTKLVKEMNNAGFQIDRNKAFS